MRKTIASVRSAFLLLVLALAIASPALASPARGQMAAAHTEAAVLPPVEPAAVKTASPGRDGVDLRDCAALVLVGTMLIGLAAAVRRTA
jgi:hypothetical protein